MMGHAHMTVAVCCASVQYTCAAQCTTQRRGGVFSHQDAGLPDYRVSAAAKHLREHLYSSPNSSNGSRTRSATQPELSIQPPPTHELELHQHIVDVGPRLLAHAHVAQRGPRNEQDLGQALILAALDLRA